MWAMSLRIYSQEHINAKQLNKAQSYSEPLVIEFWAEWNDQNKCHFLSSLNDCRVYRVCITDNPDLAESFDVKVLPTIIVFNKREEICRWKGNLLFELNVNKAEIQAKIDSIIINKFK